MLKYSFRFIIWNIIIGSSYPFILNKCRKSSFVFRSKKLKYFYHRYNTTWRNERTIEIPIIINFLQEYPHEKILEVGNVLSHYYNIDWDVLDKYEKAVGVINKDVVDFKSKKKYELIISISTLEHVAYSYENPEHCFNNNLNPAVFTKNTIKKLKYNCLSKNGKIIVTMPIDLNLYCDMYKLIFEGKFGFSEKYYMRRININNIWEESTETEIRNKNFFCSDNKLGAIFIGVM